MRNFNVRKEQILEILRDDELTAREVYKLTPPEMSIQNVMVLLKRYHKFGYLHREKNENHIFVYRINPSGLKKLNYLIDKKEKITDLTELEEIIDLKRIIKSL